MMQSISRSSIGAILTESGKLSAADMERILKLQESEGLRFGDAAIHLGLLADSDIQYALARQYDYPYLLKENKAVFDGLVAAYDPYCPQVETLRKLRSQLMMRRLAQGDSKPLSVISPGRGEGRSFLLANLAIVFSQLGEKTLLIDADMRHPFQHELFKLNNRHGLSSFLAGRDPAASIQRVDNFVDLSVLTSGPIPPNPQELLGRPAMAEFLAAVKKEYDVVLIDTPASMDFADAHVVAARSGAAIVLARKNHTPVSMVRQEVQSMTGSGIEVVGAILNEY
ncbi:MAG TPA: chain length determinant protein tyrosine kinase EpsG [Burkholderiales bacterium]|nr:chain length determinant protein tyrosine kinase EpsG [Burkholderiales bacterium]